MLRNSRHLAYADILTYADILAYANILAYADIFLRLSCLLQKIKQNFFWNKKNYRRVRYTVLLRLFIKMVDLFHS